MARKYHPDVNPSEDAKTKFQEANRAYEILSDPSTRQRYDQFGEAGVGTSAASGGGYGQGMEVDLGDIFDSFFGGGGRGPGGASGQRQRQRGETRSDERTRRAENNVILRPQFTALITEDSSITLLLSLSNSNTPIVYFHATRYARRRTTPWTRRTSPAAPSAWSQAR